MRHLLRSRNCMPIHPTCKLACAAVITLFFEDSGFIMETISDAVAESLFQRYAARARARLSRFQRCGKDRYSFASVQSRASLFRSPPIKKKKKKKTCNKGRSLPRVKLELRAVSRPKGEMRVWVNQDFSADKRSRNRTPAFSYG